MQFATPPQRILMIRPSALGDVCRTVPVLVSLRKAWPDATIDWVVQDAFVEAVAAHPDLDGAIPFPRGNLAKWWRNPRVAGRAVRWFDGLRRGSYDLVIDCQGLGRSGLMTFATRARHRVGHQMAREFAWLAYNHRIGSRRPKHQQHTVDAMLELVDAVGVEVNREMSLYVPADSAAWWGTQATGLGLRGRFAVLAPSSRWLSKRWPVDRWTDLLGPLTARGFDRAVLLAAPGEESQLGPLLELADRDERLVSLVGQTTIGQTMAVIDAAGLLVANDSAPLHMAVGLSTPSVGLFGPTDPAVVGPCEQPMHIVQADEARRQLGAVHFKDARIGDALMRLISVDDVLAAIDRRMGN